MYLVHAFLTCMHAYLQAYFSCMLKYFLHLHGYLYACLLHLNADLQKTTLTTLLVNVTYFMYITYSLLCF